jgi:hypothetical protein
VKYSEAIPASPSTATARLLESRVLRGCNVYDRSTVFCQRVDLGRFEGTRIGPELASRFVDRFASLRTPIPGCGLHAEFLAGLDSEAGAPFERALLEAIRAVELAVASAMRRLDTLEFTTLVHEPGSSRVVELVWACHAGSLSRAAARAGLAGLLELMPTPLPQADGETREDFAGLLRTLQRRGRRRQWSSTTAALAQAAKKRGIPFEPLAGAHLRLGDGVMQHVVSASASSSAALENIFPAGASASVPTALIVGNRGAGALARDLDGLLRASGSAVGLATRKLTTISGKPVDSTSRGRGGGARFVLGDPRVETLVYAVSPRRVVERGLRVDRATTTAILVPRIGGDPEVDRRGIDVCVSATTGVVVVSADHPLAERLIGELEPERLVLLSPRHPDPLVIRHLSRGGCAVVRTEIGPVEIVTLRRSRDTVASVRVTPQRSSATRVSARRIRRAMLATALAFGLGLPGDEIVAAFEKRRYFRR